MKNIVTLASISAVILFLVIVVPPVHSKFTNNISTSDVPVLNGFVYEKDAFVDACVDGAMSLGDATIDKQLIVNYCACVYNNFVEIHGQDKFTDELLKLNNGMTPEANQIVNKCLASM